VAALLFVRRVARQLSVVRSPDGAVYRISGQLFFASSDELVRQFCYAEDPAEVEIDLSAAHIWDASTVAALDAVVTRYAARGTTVRITGMNEDSAARHAALAGVVGSSG
jgi:sulfate permease, SulP family